ncbi:SAM-dependent methyltransferase [Thiotrichales bacterium 19S11-10]|nr:SAM-dependent methyltransferase [Thiotrichales bacterium 19S11-10]
MKTNHYFDTDALNNFYQQIGLSAPNNKIYPQRIKKHKQISAYVEHILSAVNKLSKKRQLTFVDCGCGRSYLSFLLYAVCHHILKRDIKIIGIDRNEKLINQCRETAKALGFDNMVFYADDLENVVLNEAIDVSYSLHACDYATDHCIAKGINLNAKYIFSVSCCQHSNRKSIQKHPLLSLTKHQAYKERLVDMLGDSLRGLLLEHKGYDVKIFEFISSSHSPKNIMLKATKGAIKEVDQSSAYDKYLNTSKIFNVKPKLEALI